MKLLTTPKEILLLEQGLETLHQQCRSWINQLDLWEDEKKFFSDLISTRLFQTSEKEKEEVEDMLRQITSEDMQALRRDLLMHETRLNTLLKKEDREEEDDYREQHKRFHERFLKLENILKSAKKTVFTLFKLVNHNFFNRNETLFTIHERRAVRKYKADKVDRSLIQEVLRAAIMAPSAVNQQPWRFYIVTNRVKLKQYAKETMQAADKVYHDLLLGLLNEEDPIFHGAPVAIFITAPKNNIWASMDIGLCAENMMLAAKSLGLDTCPVGLAKFIEKTPVYHELQIPDSECVQLAIVMGYGDEKPKVHERKTDNIHYL